MSMVTRGGDKLWRELRGQAWANAGKLAAEATEPVPEEALEAESVSQCRVPQLPRRARCLTGIS